MTSTVTIEAHCSPDKEVRVVIAPRYGAETPKEVFVLKNGEKAIRHIFDDRVLSTYEQLIEVED